MKKTLQYDAMPMTNTMMEHRVITYVLLMMNALMIVMAINEDGGDEEDAPI